ncbi:MAG: uroporphyrinogen-III C-methyltransferase [Cyclobacteriaceae bacterium]|nr:uroporphyrinogen-III C-methyltransferase [Cyclobacteriaceae bacterium]
MNGKLTLVGGGPGDPELITLKAVKALNEADVVLYDALINKVLLEHVPEKAIKINVGKRNRNHRYSQNEINRMIVHFAREDNHVVRLKGGDPFVFGRGQEELTYARKWGISGHVIPGLSSSTSVLTNAGLPLTVRGVNEGYAVVTATEKNGQLSASLKFFAQARVPVVIMMGLNKLPQIVDLFENLGQKNTPIALLQNGTCENERYLAGKIDNILELADEHKPEAPAIIVVGEVVNYRIDLKAELKAGLPSSLEIPLFDQYLSVN